MGFACAVAECKSTAKTKKERGDSLIFHRFPVKNKPICKVWTTKCHRKENISVVNCCICSNHFLEGDYEDDIMNRLLGLPQKRRLKADAVPSIFKERDQATSETTISGREERAKIRKRKALICEIPDLSTVPNTAGE
jgi:THAP domain